MAVKDKANSPRYTVGQKVIIHPMDEKGLTRRESEITKYAGQTGVISNFYWISPAAGQIFYIYKVRVGAEKKEIVVYEDEMEAGLS